MKKILLAIRYKVLLRKYTNLLMNWGFHIFATSRGAEALRLQKEHNFDLIVADFELEDMSGCTFCSLVRKEDNSQSVQIILTCYDIPERIERGKLSGASTIVIKPIDPIRFLEVIGDHAGLHLIRGKRVALEIVVTIKQNGKEFICFSRDISNTGILLKSDYELNIGNRITCKFTLPDYCQVEIDGEVVRYLTDLECDNLYGVKFIAIKPFYKRVIRNYIGSCSDRYSGTRVINSETIILDRNNGREIAVTEQVSEVA
jgi:CheY-like chemotaxis protein